MKVYVLKMTVLAMYFRHPSNKDELEEWRGRVTLREDEELMGMTCRRQQGE